MTLRENLSVSTECSELTFMSLKRPDDLLGIGKTIGDEETPHNNLCSFHSIILAVLNQVSYIQNPNLCGSRPQCRHPNNYPMSLLPIDSNVFLDLHQYYHLVHSEHSAPCVIVSVMSDVNIFATKLQCEYKLFQFFLVICNVHFVYNICKTYCE